MSDPETHLAILETNRLLQRIISLLTLQSKGEFTLMTEIESAVEDLRQEVEAEKDAATANNLLLDGVTKILGDGIAKIADLTERLLVVSNDPQMVRDLAAEMKATASTQAAKFAALQAKGAELAAAVTANTTTTATTGAVSSGTAGNASTGVSGSNTSSGVSAGGTAPTTSMDTSTSTTSTDASSSAGTTTTSTDTGPTLDPSGGNSQGSSQSGSQDTSQGGPTDS